VREAEAAGVDGPRGARGRRVAHELYDAMRDVRARAAARAEHERGRLWRAERERRLVEEK